MRDVFNGKDWQTACAFAADKTSVSSVSSGATGAAVPCHKADVIINLKENIPIAQNCAICVIGVNPTFLHQVPF
jgi:hypothetical protein